MSKFTKQYPNAPSPSAISYDCSRARVISFFLSDKLTMPCLMRDSRSKESNCTKFFSRPFSNKAIGHKLQEQNRIVVCCFSLHPEECQIL